MLGRTLSGPNLAFETLVQTASNPVCLFDLLLFELITSLSVGEIHLDSSIFTLAKAPNDFLKFNLVEKGPLSH